MNSFSRCTSRKSSLTTSARRLVELMQQISFGTIEGLHIRRGEPVWDPPPRVVHETKFGAPSGPRPEARLEDFALKVEVIELMQRIEDLQDGIIDRIEIRHGLPFRMVVVETAAA